MIGRQPKADQVVEDNAVVIAHNGIQGLVHSEFASIVRDQLLYERQGIRPPDVKLTHMRDIAQADALTRRPMLRHMAAILHGTRKALKIDDRRRVADMLIK